MLVGAAPKVGVPNTVRVFTRSAANVASDQDFYVQVSLPGLTSRITDARPGRAARLARGRACARGPLRGVARPPSWGVAPRPHTVEGGVDEPQPIDPRLRRAGRGTARLRGCRRRFAAQPGLSRARLRLEVRQLPGSDRRRRRRALASRPARLEPGHLRRPDRPRLRFHHPIHQLARRFRASSRRRQQVDLRDPLQGRRPANQAGQGQVHGVRIGVRQGQVQDPLVGAGRGRPERATATAT